MNGISCFESSEKKPGCMMTSLNGNIFRVTGSLWGESTAYRWIPLTKGCDTDPWFFSLTSAWLNKQSRRQWLETPYRSLWRHCNDNRTEEIWFRDLHPCFLPGIPPRPLVHLHIGDPSSSGRVSLVLTWQLPNDTDISHVPVLAVHMALYTVFTDGASSPDYIFPAHSVR